MALMSLEEANEIPVSESLSQSLINPWHPLKDVHPMSLQSIMPAQIFLQIKNSVSMIHTIMAPMSDLTHRAVILPLNFALPISLPQVNLILLSCIYFQDIQKPNENNTPG
jgi:hypothetical protein